MWHCSNIHVVLEASQDLTLVRLSIYNVTTVGTVAEVSPEPKICTSFDLVLEQYGSHDMSRADWHCCKDSLRFDFEVNVVLEASRVQTYLLVLNEYPR
jgi:hypothetical protein